VFFKRGSNRFDIFASRSTRNYWFCRSYGWHRSNRSYGWHRSNWSYGWHRIHRTYGCNGTYRTNGGRTNRADWTDWANGSRTYGWYWTYGTYWSYGWYRSNWYRV